MSKNSRKSGLISIISVWSPKGGVGKTTIAINITSALKAQGHEVLLCDLDPQESSVWVASHGRLCFEVINHLPVQKPKVNYVILDHPPGAEAEYAYPNASVVIVPIRPSALDHAAANAAIKKLPEDKMLIRVLNSVDIRRTEEQGVVAHFRAKENAIIIKNRSIYPRSIGMGMSVFHPDLSTLYGIADARKEFGEMANTIQRHFSS